MRSAVPAADSAGEASVDRPNLGEDGKQILSHFRTVAKSYADLFRAQRNHVHELLRGAHSYASGVFRESLLRNFLTNVLPPREGSVPETCDHAAQGKRRATYPHATPRTGEAG